jgi:hypothetical protein
MCSVFLLNQRGTLYDTIYYVPLSPLFIMTFPFAPSCSQREHAGLRTAADGRGPQRMAGVKQCRFFQRDISYLGYRERIWCHCPRTGRGIPSCKWAGHTIYYCTQIYMQNQAIFLISMPHEFRVNAYRVLSTYGRTASRLKPPSAARPRSI